jgi:hypothetical protein
VYSINATFVTSCNTTKVRVLDVIVPRPSTLHFLGGSRNDRLNEFVMLIYIYNNAMRSCNERTILHCVESYLYYVILVNKKNIFGGVKRGRKKIDNISTLYIHCRKYKIYIYEFWRVFLTCFAASGKDLYIFRQYTYIVPIVLFQKPQRNCQIV